MPREALSSARREEALARLAAVLTALAERRAAAASPGSHSPLDPVGHSAGSRLAVRTGWPGVDAALGGLARGVIHEWFGVADSAAGHRSASEGDTDSTPVRRTVRHPVWTPPLRILAALAGAALAHAHSTGARSVVWIGRRVWPYPRALLPAERITTLGPTIGEGAAPEGPLPEGPLPEGPLPEGPPSSLDTETSDLLAASLFVDPPDDAARLWAIDLAIRCPALAAVVADGRGLSMPASRRLQLAAERAGGPLVLLARPPSERAMPSVAGSRWSVEREGAATRASEERERSGGPASDPADHPRWAIEVLRWKGAGARVLSAGGGGETGRRWTLEWNHAEGAVVERAVVADGSSRASGATAVG